MYLDFLHHIFDNDDSLPSYDWPPTPAPPPCEHRNGHIYSRSFLFFFRRWVTYCSDCKQHIGTVLHTLDA